MKIRLAEASHAEAIKEFNKRMADETEGLQLNEQVLEDGVKAVFEGGGQGYLADKGFYLVAEDGEMIVGCLLITREWSDWRNAWFWWIQSVYVLPEYRGKGVYRRLYEFVKEEARRLGIIAGFRLYVEHDNYTAQQVYKKLGMSESHYLMFEELIK
ncbi:MAG TPA: GNAT family N-acetyltransferase [Pyrinomonadaceae bacterium]|nr:GNAT family N-acetyltransferase [Pyrinomonadaceae bacterium]